MGKELDAALARRKQREFRAKAEETLRSIPGITVLGFDEDPALPEGSRAFGVANRLDAQYDSEVSEEALASERKEWLLRHVQRAGITEECYLFMAHGVPWVKVRIQPEAWTLLLAQERDLLALGVGPEARLLAVIDDWHERRALAFVLDPRQFSSRSTTEGNRGPARPGGP